MVIDPTNKGHLRLRLSSREPSSEIAERGLRDAAIQFHANAQIIDEAGAGIKAFAGIIIEAIAGDPLVLLIDEPEAFSHPSLSHKLVNEIGQATIHSEKRLLFLRTVPVFLWVVFSPAHSKYRSSYL